MFKCATYIVGVSRRRRRRTALELPSDDDRLSHGDKRKIHNGPRCWRDDGQGVKVLGAPSTDCNIIPPSSVDVECKTKTASCASQDGWRTIAMTKLAKSTSCYILHAALNVELTSFANILRIELSRCHAETDVGRGLKYLYAVSRGISILFQHPV